MATPEQARRWAKADATEQRILDAATEVFAIKGFSAARMADVVAGSVPASAASTTTSAARTSYFWRSSSYATIALIDRLTE